MYQIKFNFEGAITIDNADLTPTITEIEDGLEELLSNEGIKAIIHVFNMEVKQQNKT